MKFIYCKRDLPVTHWTCAWPCLLPVLCACTVGSGCSMSPPISVFLLQTGMILGYCIKCSILKYYSSIASRFPSVFGRASVFSWLLLHLCFEPCFEFLKLSMGDLALSMLNKIWITDPLFQEVGRIVVFLLNKGPFFYILVIGLSQCFWRVLLVRWCDIPHIINSLKYSWN